MGLALKGRPHLKYDILYLMFISEIQGDDIRLKRPLVQRDAPLSVEWLRGEEGRKSLLFMGVPEEDITEPTLEAEQTRIQSFLDRKDQLNWMIEYKNRVVGAIWVDLEPTEYVKAPTPHIMIGDISARGRGVGSQAMKLVIQYLFSQGHDAVYTRCKPSNTAVMRMNAKLGFQKDGEEYIDTDGITWQNVVIKRGRM